MKMMMRSYTLILTLALLPTLFNANAQDFSGTATSWALPSGGEILSGTDYSYRHITHSIGFSDSDGSHGWTVMDMNGDAKPDLVVYAEKQSGDNKVFNPDVSPHWKVYFGDGEDFSSTSTAWALPAGGEQYLGNGFSFRNISHTISGTDTNGSQAWTLMDMNGDGKPDLVIYAEVQSGESQVFNPSVSPHWKVYLNTGTDFSSTVTSWALPAGGEIDGSTAYSFRHISHTITGSDPDGSQGWGVVDMNADHKPDLVVYAEVQSSESKVFNPDVNPHWMVYLSDGEDFSSTSEGWKLPTGGEINSSTNYSYRNLGHSLSGSDSDGSQAWTLMDMNGDHFPDLVVYAEKQSGENKVFNPDVSPHWRVYLGNSSDFSSTSTNWALPDGGEINGGTDYSFRSIAHIMGGADSDGSQAWTLMDMTADHRPDLVVYAEKQSGEGEVFNPAVTPHWRVYVNNGGDFESNSEGCQLPTGGEINSSTDYSFRHTAHVITGADSEGSQAWSVMDMNGDNLADLVVYAEVQSSNSMVFNPAVSPHWKVYLNTADVTGVEEETATSLSKVYPNPTSDVSYIDLEDAAQYMISITDNVGKLMHTEQRFAQGRLDLDVRDYPSGLYHVRVTSNKGEVNTMLIKQ